MDIIKIMKESNFEFLKGTNDFLYNMACAAESHFPDDPNTTLIKLRMFGEASAKHIAKLLCIDIPDKQVDLLRELAKVPWVDDAIINIFHNLRQLGNKAVHDFHNDLGDAEMALRVCYRLSIWYYRILSKDKEFSAKKFEMPTSQNQQKYIEQVKDLKAELEIAKSVRNESVTQTEENKNKLVALTGYISILEGKQEETKSQTKARIAALEAQLKQKDAELQKKTEKERKEYKKQITKKAASRSLNLDENETRYLIDGQLRKAEWDADTQQLKYSNGTRPQSGRNMAIAEWPTADGGFADYVLFAGLIPVGIIEAKKANVDVKGKLSTEADRYSLEFDIQWLIGELKDEAADEDALAEIDLAFKDYPSHWPSTQANKVYQVPFIYSANGREYRRHLLTKSGIWFRDVRRNNNLPKALPEWHNPEELLGKLKQNIDEAHQWLNTRKADNLGLRYYQEEAVFAVEKAVQEGKQEALLAMATGTGKTRTAIAIMFRLIQSKRFNRILFLVDRRSLGTQALDSFDDTRINDTRFNEIFGVKGLTDRFPSDATKIHVATVQSLVKRTLQSEEVMPVGRYDCIIVDEAHRGYALDKEQTDGEMEFRNAEDYVSSYRRIIDQFDAFRVGLTATPAEHTKDIFGSPAYRYTYRQAVIDGFLCDQEPPIKITTKLSRDNVHFDAGAEVTRLTKKGELILDDLADEQDFAVSDFNRGVIAPNFNRAVCGELVNHIDPTSDQKTLIFCVDNSHADFIVDELSQQLAKKYPDLEHDAVLKITGASDKDPKKVDKLITRFKKQRLPNVAVTVSLLTTGIDVPKICNIVFLRKVRSRILYEQMKGRATRLCPEIGKTAFKIFDAVDLYSTLESVDTMRPVVMSPSIELKELVSEITDSETYKVKEADGRSFADHSHDQLVSKLQRIVSHANFNRQKSPEIDKAIKRFDDILPNLAGCDFSTLASTLKTKGAKLTAEVFAKEPALIGRLEDLKRHVNDARKDPIFTDMPDEVVDVTHEYGQYDNPEDFLEAFDSHVSGKMNDHMGMQAVLTKPRDLTRKGLIELQEYFDKEFFEESTLRAAWKKTKNQDIAARLIGHIRRVALGDALIPFDERVDVALQKILTSKAWNTEQIKWLERLADTLKQSVAIDDDTFKTGNYKRRGGKKKLETIFEGELDTVLNLFTDHMWEQPA